MTLISRLVMLALLLLLTSSNGVTAQTVSATTGAINGTVAGALTQQPYTAYGLTSGGGVNRGMVEGIMVNEGAGGGGSDLYYTDYGSFAEIAVNAVGNTAEMPNPGVFSQLIAKSGGNTYHGTLYVDFENDSMESHNIDQAQLNAGVIGSSVLAATDTNRLTTFKDFNADPGGYIAKDRTWWYGAFRRTTTGQRYPTLVDDGSRNSQRDDSRSKKSLHESPRPVCARGVDWCSRRKASARWC